jgi:hypothetical protein
MYEIYSLVKSLTPGEWQSFQSFLSSFSSHNPAELKQLQLARLLWDAQECPSHKNCCLKIYGLKADPCFEVLKTRLKEKTLDFLLTDISGDKQQELDDVDYAVIKMKKKSAQFHQLYYSKRRMPLLYDLLEDIISSAKEYEKYNILVEHLKAKKSYLSYKKSAKDFEMINTEMEYSSKCSIICDKAEHYYYRVGMLEAFSSKPDKQKALLALKENISEVQAGFEFTNSPKVHYYLKYLELAYYQLQEDHRQARSVCLELLNIVRNNKSVYRRQRVGVAYDDLSQCEFYLGDFKQAVECAREAQHLFNQGSENYCIALEQEFYALFAMQQYSQSTDIAAKMIAGAPRQELGEFRYAKYNYLLANSLFKQRRFQEASHILTQKRELSKDKNGWETGARVLTVMTLIELLKLDEASLAILSLKQFFKRMDEKTPVSLRDKTILNLLLNAERNGFAFTTLNGNTEKYISCLQSKEESGGWKPFTHEVIPFQEWFAEKMGKAVPYLRQSQKETLTANDREKEVLKIEKKTTS